MVKRLCRGGDTLLSRPGGGAELRFAGHRLAVPSSGGRAPRGPQEIRFPGRSCRKRFEIALDAMGGDVGASVVIPGAAIALARHPDTEFLLFGDRALIDPNSRSIRR